MISTVWRGIVSELDFQATIKDFLSFLNNLT
jgi:hypothetical protein